MSFKHLSLGVSVFTMGSLLSSCGGEENSNSAPPPAANRAPSVSLSDVPTEIREGEALSFTISGTDPDGNSLSYSIETTEGPDLGLSVTGTTASGTAPSVDSDSAATIRVTASDGRLSGAATASLTILNNAAPTASLTAPQEAVREGTTLTLDASASEDSEGDNLSYIYAVIAGPDVDLSGQGGDTVSFVAPDVDADETLTVQVSVDDGRDVTTETVDLTVLNNAPPAASFTASPMTVDEGEDIEFNASDSTDTENDVLTYSYVQISGPEIDVDDTASVVTIVAPEVDADSVLTVEVQVSDGRDVSTRRVDVEVKNVVQSPAFPLTLEIEQSVSIDGELFGIEGFLNPTSDGLIAVSDVDGGLIGLRTVRIIGDATFLDGSEELLTPQFERGATIRQGAGSVYIVTETDGITFLQKDDTKPDAVFSVAGKLDIEQPCSSEMSPEGSSAGKFFVVGRAGGVDFYTYNTDEQNVLDFDSFVLRGSINNGRNYCAFSSPGITGFGDDNGSLIGSFLGFDKDTFDIQQFEIDDDGAGGIAFSAGRRIENSTLPVGQRRFVKGISRPGFGRTMAVIVSDDEREGTHSLQYISESIGSDLIRIYTGDWALGTPADLGFVQFEAGEDTYVFAATPDTPQAIGFRVPLFNVTSGPLEATYLDVGLGASIAYGTRAAVGDDSDNGFHGLIFGYPEKRKITRFDQSDLPAN